MIAVLYALFKIFVASAIVELSLFEPQAVSVTGIIAKTSIINIENITEEIANRLELGFIIPKTYWLNLQENYDKRRF